MRHRMIRFSCRMRQIPLDGHRRRRQHVYQAAVRTPLVGSTCRSSADGVPAPEVYLKLESLQPIGSFKIRGAWNAVRAAVARASLRDGVWTVSAGNAAQGVAFAARRAGAPCSVMVMDTAPQTKLRAIERLGATIVTATYDECWKTVESHGSTRMRGHFVHPFDDDRFHRRQRHRGPRDPRRPAGRRCGGRAARRRRAAGGHRRGDARAQAGRHASIAAEPETAAPLAHVARRAARRATSTAGQPSFVDGAGGKSVLPTMWPLLKTLVDGSIVVPLDEVRAAMRRTAERVHVVAEGAGGTARSPPRSAAAPAAARSSPSCPAATSTSSRFAELRRRLPS